MLMSGGRLGRGNFDLVPLSGPCAGLPLLASCSFIAHPIPITMQVSVVKTVSNASSSLVAISSVASVEYK